MKVQSLFCWVITFMQNNNLFHLLRRKLLTDVLYNSKILHYNLCIVTFLKHTYSSFTCTLAMEPWALNLFGVFVWNWEGKCGDSERNIQWCSTSLYSCTCLWFSYVYCNKYMHVVIWCTHIKKKNEKNMHF